MRTQLRQAIGRGNLNLLWGLLLVGGGVLLLLQSLGVLTAGLFWGPAFAVVGGV